MTTTATAAAARAEVPDWDGASVRDVIDRHAEACGERVFFVSPDSGTQVSYTDLRERAAAFAERLTALGIRPGESVGFALANGWAATEILLGCLYGGFRATPVNLVAGVQTLGHVLGHSRTRIVFVEDGHRDLLAQASAGLDAPPPLVRVDPARGVDWEEAAAPVAAAPASRVPVTADTIGLLMYTSGTTGTPKGVLLSHANLIAGGRNTALAHRLGPEDRALCVLPLYHINGQCVTVLGPLVSGGSVVMPHRFSATAFWRQAVHHGCTWFSVVPTLVSYLLHAPPDAVPGREQLDRIRFGRSASAPLPPEVHRAFEQHFGIPLIETMGLTETAAPILSNPLDPGKRKYGSPGIPWGNEVIVADEAQRECPRNTPGEVLVRGPNVMCGYLDNPQATAEALTADGWLRTGDLGVMDDDGYVFITGRLKELIIKGGENIAPREIDEALYGHEAVVEAAAFARPCDRYGQTVEACVVLREGAAVDEAALIALCAERVGPFKAPERVHVVAELPKGPSGKIQRMKLAELVA